MWTRDLIKVSLWQTNKITSISEQTKVSTRSWSPQINKRAGLLWWNPLIRSTSFIQMCPDWKRNYAGACARNERVPVRKVPFVLWLMSNIDSRLEGLVTCCGGRMKRFRFYYLASVRCDCSSVLSHWRRMGFLLSVYMRLPSEWGHHLFHNCL